MAASSPPPSAPSPAQPGNVGGNVYDKYGTTNPIARRLMRGFLGAFDELTAGVDPATAFEVGCGEGHLALRLLEKGVAVRGVDLEANVVADANQRAAAAGHGEPFRVQSLYDLDPAAIDADLVVCCEVLEHVPEPEQALATLHSLARPYALLSVPREPLWRVLNVARGRYLSAWGNTPGHLQHWSRRRFLDFVASRFAIEEVRSPLPWTMVLARRV